MTLPDATHLLMKNKFGPGAFCKYCSWRDMHLEEFDLKQIRDSSNVDFVKCLKKNNLSYDVLISIYEWECVKEKVPNLFVENLIDAWFTIKTLDHKAYPLKRSSV